MKALADEWLVTMSAISWNEAATSIRNRHPQPCGETTQIELQGALFDVSDSWEWDQRQDGDIRLTIKVFDCSGSNELVATRTAVIRRCL